MADQKSSPELLESDLLQCVQSTFENGYNHYTFKKREPNPAKQVLERRKGGAMISTQVHSFLVEHKIPTDRIWYVLEEDTGRILGLEKTGDLNVPDSCLSRMDKPFKVQMEADVVELLTKRGQAVSLNVLEILRAD